MFVLFSLQKQKEENKTKNTLTLSRLKRKPVEVPPIARSNRTIADEQGHTHGPLLPLALEALCDCVSAFVCVSINTLSREEAVKSQWT